MSNTDFDIDPYNNDANPIFAAYLIPHRSLSSTGFGLLMLLIAAICISNAYFYYYLGAWPVTLFFFFDTVILYLAFKLNYRAGKMREEIIIKNSRLHIRKISPNGTERHHTYNPYWAKFQIERHEEIGITAMRITGEGYQSTIGSFLNPADKESFANAFSAALAKVKKQV